MITYDGVDLGELLFIQDIERPIMPGQKLETVKIEGRHGVIYMFKKHEAITLPVKIIISADSIEILNTRKREIANALNKDEPKRIIFNDEPDKYIEGIIIGDTQFSTLATHGEATLNFFCPDPFWYAIEDDIFEFTELGVNDFVRKGNIESEPIIEVQGQIISGSLVFILNGKSMAYMGTLNLGETLVVDSKWMTAFVEDEEGNRRSAINDLDTLEFLKTRAGLNNFVINATGEANISRITLTCRSRWI